jgi:hypothetical protein
MPNKHVDLFKDIIPAVDLGLMELWDATSDEGRKEIEGDLWNLNRYISNVKSSNKELQQHYVLTVNQFYNLNWNDIRKEHPKLAWMSLCVCSHESKKTYFHEYIPLKTSKNKKEAVLSKLFPDMKYDDVNTLAKISTEKEIKQYCIDAGWDQKAVHELKL